MTVERPEPEARELVAPSDVIRMAPTTGPGGGWIPSSVAATSTETEVRPLVASVPLAANVHVLVPLGVGQSREELLARADQQARETDRLDEFDQPERDRIYALSETFVANHVRALRPGFSLRVAGRTFSSHALVVSESRVPALRLRRTRLNWIVDGGRVVDVSGHHVSLFRLQPTDPRPRQPLRAPVHGDRPGLAYFLAGICALVGFVLPEALAAEGEFSLRMNEFVDHGPTDDEREAVARDGMAHFVFSRRAGLIAGAHGTVRYWPAADANEAAFSMLAAAAHETTVPDLKRRWRLKVAASWISMLAVLAGVCAGQFAGFLSGYPTLLRTMVGVTTGLWIVGAYATHRFWRLDR